jgi:type II secretory pathway component PulC
MTTNFLILTIMKKNYSKLLKLTWALWFAAMFSLTFMKATVIPVSPVAADSNLVRVLLDTANIKPGDTIMLDAGTYIEPAGLKIFKTITIMGNPEAVTPPLVNVQSSGLNMNAERISLTVKGIVFSGMKADSSGVIDNFFIVQANNCDTFINLKFLDCTIRDFNRVFHMSAKGNFTCDSLIVDGLTMYNKKGTNFVFTFGDKAYPKYFGLTNSTFYNVEGGIIDNPRNNQTGAPAYTPKIKIFVDHNTFYNIVSQHRSLIQTEKITTPDSLLITFSNNIIEKLMTPGYFSSPTSYCTPFKNFNATTRATSSANVTFINNSVSNFDATHDSASYYNFDAFKTASNVTANANLTDYPQFADTSLLDGDDYDLTIPYGSPLLKAGTDGNAIGDPRWWPAGYVPGSNIHKIPSTPADTLEHFIENISYWDPCDIIMLTDDTTYIVSNTIDIYQELTVMGDPSLSKMPELRFYDNGFRLKEDTISVTFKNLKFNGLKADDVSRAGYILRFDQNAWYNWRNVVIQNCEAYNFVGGLQLSKNVWCTYDSVIIDNVIWHHFTTNAIEPRRGATKFMSVTNSTFYDIDGAFMTNPYYSDGTRDTVQQEIVMDRNTLFKVVKGSNSFIQSNDPKDGSVHLTFTNNIVSTLLDTANARPFRIDPLAGEFVFSHSTFHNFWSNFELGKYNLDSAARQANVHVSNIYSYYPAFSDSASRYFMLPDTSSLLAAAIDGGAIGDPRWVPQVGVKIRPVTGKIIPGDEIQLVADVTLSSGADHTVTWTVINNYEGTSGSATIGASDGLFIAVNPGMVKVTATSNYNPALFDTVVITIDPQIFVTSVSLASFRMDGTPSSAISVQGDSLNVIAVVNPSNADNKSLTWSLSGTGSATIKELNANTIRIIATGNGTLTVRATANDGSSVYGEKTITISGQPSSINDAIINTITVVPNPAADYIMLSQPVNANIVLYTILGEKVLEREYNGNNTIDISNLKAGVYLVEIKINNHTNFIKFLKN